VKLILQEASQGGSKGKVVKVKPKAAKVAKRTKPKATKLAKPKATKLAKPKAAKLARTKTAPAQRKPFPSADAPTRKPVRTLNKSKNGPMKPASRPLRPVTPIAEPSGASRPTMDLTRPEDVADLAYLVCFRGRKFGRARFARLVQDRIGASESTERFIGQMPVEMIAVFLAREVRPVSDDRAPVNECFELPDGGLLEFVGDHMEAAETVARLLLIHDETRLDHVVELLAEHDLSWLHTLALEARDARLMELGFPDLDDVDRLFAPWHAQLLIRKLHASLGLQPPQARVRTARPKVTAEQVLEHAHGLKEPTRRGTMERLHFLAVCQAIHDAKRIVRRLTPDNLNRSAAQALRYLAQGIQEAGGDLSVIEGPQIATVYRLGLATSA